MALHRHIVVCPECAGLGWVPGDLACPGDQQGEAQICALCGGQRTLWREVTIDVRFVPYDPARDRPAKIHTP